MCQITIQQQQTINGEYLILFRIQNKQGCYVEILNFGATLVSIVVPDKKGNLENIILRYDNIADYLTDSFYLGCTVGRFANRIGGAKFTLNGKTYFLDKNDGNNSNHGGFNGFNSKIFDYEIQDDKLILSCESEDGEGGFPGNIKFTVTYSFTDNNELHIEFDAISDMETIFNPTNHAYFNLSEKKETILNHKLKVFSDSYLETNDEFIPTGKINSISYNPAFDFRDYQEISGLMPLKNEIIEGYNTYFISKFNNKIKQLASLTESESGITVDIYSSMSGVQIYTGDYLSEPHQPFAGICLEAQFFPDSPNHPNFETCILKPDEEVTHSIIIAIN